MTDGKLSILVVDDEISGIHILNNALKRTYTVYVAKNGRNAIKIATKHRPDIILLDLVLPDINGFEVITELKRSNITKNIPVIIVTGLDNDEDEEKAFSLGAIDYVTKPFNSAILKAKIAAQLQIVNRIKTIEKIVTIDPLTSILNKHGFENQLNLEWKRAFREKNPISLLMIDLDKFEEYNEKHGHPQGDVALKQIAITLKKIIKRGADFVALWGDEEFVIILPNTDLAGAQTVAEHIRAFIETSPIALPNDDNSFITVSVGVNSQTPDNNNNATDFVFKAEKALYKAKNAGRNKVFSVTDF